MASRRRPELGRAAVDAAWPRLSPALRRTIIVGVGDVVALVLVAGAVLIAGAFATPAVCGATRAGLAQRD